MLVLDENLPASQQRLLRKWRIHFRFVGVHVAESGTEDENLIPLLHRLPQPTFFSMDRNFYRRDWMHQNYCLVWLDVRSRQGAEFIRRFLRHPSFSTQARRRGIVARVHAGGVIFWRAPKRSRQSVAWPGP